MRIRIAIVEDQHLFRQALAHRLSGEPGCEIVGELEDGREALEHARKHRPDVMLMDLVMPGLSGLDVIRKIVRQGLATHCLAVSSCLESRTVIEAMEAGARGYVTKNVVCEQLIEAIRAVMAGQKWLSPAVTDTFVQRYWTDKEQTGNAGANGKAKARPSRNGNGKGKGDGSGNGNGEGNGNGGSRSRRAVSELTPREREVLQLLADGRANKQIAADLSLSVKTIDSHRAALMKKLQLHSVAHLTKYALREGMTTLDF